MKLNIKSLLLICPLIFIFGLLVGAVLSKYSLISFKNEISLGEVSNLIIAAFIAIYVPFFLDKKINNKRAEKDILIQLCGRLDAELHGLIKSVIDPIHISGAVVKRSESRTILVRSRTIHNTLDLLIKDVTSYTKDKEIKKLTDELIRNHDSFWNDLTFNINAKNTKITQEMYLSTERNLNTYSSNISALMIRINNS